MDGYMNKVIEIDGLKISTLQKVEYSKWQCHLFGMDNTVLRPLEGQHPNWFWRKMQFLCFGNRWVKDA